MKLFLDAIEESALERFRSGGPFYGVTTNPLILAAAGIDAAEAVRRCRRAGVERLFLQARWGSADDLVREAGRLAGLFDGELWIKIPALPWGFAAMARLAGRGPRTAATAVVSVGQAVLAAASGAAVVIPFLGRAESSGVDPAELLRDCGAAAESSGARVLAASVKTEGHLRLALRAGVWAATLPVGLVEGLEAPEAARGVLEQFRRVEEASGPAGEE